MEDKIKRAEEIARTAKANIGYLFKNVEGYFDAIDMAMLLPPAEIVKRAKAGERIAFLAAQQLVRKSFLEQLMDPIIPARDPNTTVALLEFSVWSIGRGPPPKGQRSERAKKLNTLEKSKYIFELASEISDRTKLAIHANDEKGHDVLAIIAAVFCIPRATIYSRYNAGRKHFQN